MWQFCPFNHGWRWWCSIDCFPCNYDAFEHFIAYTSFSLLLSSIWLTRYCSTRVWTIKRVYYSSIFITSSHLVWWSSFKDLLTKNKKKLCKLWTSTVFWSSYVILYWEFSIMGILPQVQKRSSDKTYACCQRESLYYAGNFYRLVNSLECSLVCLSFIVFVRCFCIFCSVYLYPTESNLWTG